MCTCMSDCGYVLVPMCSCVCGVRGGRGEVDGACKCIYEYVSFCVTFLLYKSAEGGEGVSINRW